MSGLGDPPPDLNRPGFGTPPPADASPPTVPISVRVNGEAHTAEVEPRTLLADFLRHQLGLTGTKVGCEHGVCGACTVQLDGEPVRSCLTFAVQVDQAHIWTIEGLADGRLQRSFHEHHALQCGFCTAGFLMTLDAYLEDHPDPTEPELKEALAGNLCRCTGYAPIIKAVRER